MPKKKTIVAVHDIQSLICTSLKNNSYLMHLCTEELDLKQQLKIKMIFPSATCAGRKYPALPLHSVLHLKSRQLLDTLVQGKLDVGLQEKTKICRECRVQCFLIIQCYGRWRQLFIPITCFLAFKYSACCYPRIIEQTNKSSLCLAKIQCTN
jgi:hypothetical protein